MITARGSFRRLTPGEITLSRFLYKMPSTTVLLKCITRAISRLVCRMRKRPLRLMVNFIGLKTLQEDFPQKQRATYGGSCMKWPTYGSIRWG